MKTKTENTINSSSESDFALESRSGVSVHAAQHSPSALQHERFDSKQHLHVLIHGLSGKADDLWYLGNQLEERGFAVLRVQCNEGRTTDGVRRGAVRIANEIQAFLEEADANFASSSSSSELLEINGTSANASGELAHDVDTQGQSVPPLKSISLVGHSLGGIYARLAAALLFDPSSGLVAGLEPVSLMTLATPHLGVRRFTYLPTQWVPSPSRRALSRLLFGQTGLDLFLDDAADGEYRKQQPRSRTPPIASGVFGGFVGSGSGVDGGVGGAAGAGGVGGVGGGGDVWTDGVGGVGGSGVSYGGGSGATRVSPLTSARKAMLASSSSSAPPLTKSSLSTRLEGPAKGGSGSGGGGWEAGVGARSRLLSADALGGQPLLVAMATQEEFLSPLRAFKKRTCYGCVAGDFLVPFATANFPAATATTSTSAAVATPATASLTDEEEEEEERFWWGIADDLRAPGEVNDDKEGNDQVSVWEVDEEEEEELPPLAARAARVGGGAGAGAGAETAATSLFSPSPSASAAAAAAAAAASADASSREVAESSMAAALNSLGWSKVAVRLQGPIRLLRPPPPLPPSLTQTELRVAPWQKGEAEEEDEGSQPAVPSSPWPWLPPPMVAKLRNLTQGWKVSPLSLASLLPKPLQLEQQQQQQQQSDGRAMPSSSDIDLEVGGSVVSSASSSAATTTTATDPGRALAWFSLVGRRRGLTPPPLLEKGLTPPLAHNMIVALGRRDTSFSGALYEVWQRGRPVMDHAANALAAASAAAAAAAPASTEGGRGLHPNSNSSSFSTKLAGSRSSSNSTQESRPAEIVAMEDEGLVA